MNISELITYLNDRGIFIKANGANLNIRAEAGEVPANILQMIRESKRDLVEFLNAAANTSDVEKKSTAIKKSIIKNTDRTIDFPLSYSQQSLWFMDQLADGNAVWNMPMALMLTGDLNAKAMRHAIDAIVERHEILRTVYIDCKGECVQRINPPSSVIIDTLDLNPLTNTDDVTHLSQKQIDMIGRVRTEEANRKFDLSKDLMLRVSHVLLSPQTNIILFTLHHIASDGWSMSILANEFIKIYSAYCDNENSPLAALEVQYADYAYWQKQQSQTAFYANAMAYWLEQLQNLPETHSVMLDYPRPARQDYSGETFTQRFPQALSEQLNQLAQRENVSLFMLLQAAFSLLLGRWSGSSDVVIGTPIAGRNYKEVEPLLGFFVNNLILRTDLDKALTFRELLTQCRENCLNAFEYQMIPFDLLVDKLQLTRNLSHSPAFQIVFSLANNEKAKVELPNLKVESLDESLSYLQASGSEDYSRVDGAKVDIELTVAELENGLELKWLYAKALFKRSTIKDIAESFSVLLKDIVSNPDKALQQVSIISQQQQAQITVWENGPEEKIPLLCMHQIFEQQVNANSHAIAVKSHEGSLTYAQLNQKANQLAHYLINEGVKPDSLIGIYCDHSPTLMVALIATLKSGAAYVPLNIADPVGRVHGIINDNKINIVLTRNKLHSNFFESNHQLVACRLLSVDAEDKAAIFSAQKNTNPECVDLTLAHLAYVIFTSGSTGKPKGVMVNHRGLINYLQHANKMYLKEHILGALVSTPLTFDATITTLYTPLIAGKFVEFIPDDSNLLPRLADYLFDDDDSLLFKITPAHLAALNNLGGSNKKSAHVIVVGGEQLTVSTLRPWLTKRLPQSIFINEYGPTETVVGCSVYTVSGADAEKLTGLYNVPIGVPINNTLLHVLNQDLQRQPPNAIGELFIAGSGVARGYLGQESLSAAKFIKNHLSSDATEFFYRTGDKVRWLADGNLEFLGRIDDQIKIRGFRIEPAEIEYYINQHPDISYSLVLARDFDESSTHKNKDLQLVAYFISPAVAKSEYTDEWKTKISGEIRALLQRNLPAYMVPTLFIPVPEIPLTSNGKVDKTLLPAISQNGFNRDYVEPSTDTEWKMLLLWQDVLQHEKISVTANFFNIGGHSLLATRLVSAISEKFNKSIGLAAIFESSTIRELCAWLDQQQVITHQHIPRINRTDMLPLSFAQQRLWFIDQLQGESLQYVMTLPLRLTGELNISALKEALDIVLERHEVLRTVFPIVEEEVYQHICSAGSMDVATFDFSVVAEGDREALINKLIHDESERGFNLIAEYPWRVSLIILSKDDHILLFSMHHIASDGWSMEILIREFRGSYAACCEGARKSLAPLAIQYADYSAWQRQQLNSDAQKKPLAYWQHQLADLPRVHSLPLDKPRAAQQDFIGETWTSWIDQHSLDGIYTLAKEYDASLYMVLQSAFALLLSRWSGETDIVMGTPVAGRLHKEIEPLIGFFVNNLVMRTDIASSSTFVDLLLQCRKNALDAYENQIVPFEMLVEQLRVERSLSHAPVFQIVFDLQNNRTSELNLPELHIKEMSATKIIANYDLELHISEKEGQGLQCYWVFADSLFEQSSIMTMAESFTVLLKGIVADSRKPVSEYSLLSQSDQESFLRWNETSVDLPSQCVHELFEQQVAQSPNAVAIVDGTENITYAELNAQANQLAYYLTSLGVSADEPIVICLERGIDFIVGLLGIVKAGAAYLPIDPNYPEERISYLIEDASAKIILTNKNTYYQLPITDQKVFFLNKEIRKKLLAPYSEENLAKDLLNLTARNLAYVIYTSGTTGTSVGVMNTHEALVNLCSWHKRYYAIDQMARVSHLATIGFDAAVWEVWPNLLAGACLIIISDDVRVTPHLLNRALQDNKVTHSFMPTGLLEEMVENLSDVDHLKFILTGGDKLSINALPSFVNAKLINHYGPTEAAVVTTVHPVTASAGLPPIGAPIDNFELYILDRHDNQVPVGVIGELYIGGVGLARGYLHRPDLTEKRFVYLRPYNRPTLRLFKSGDLVRWRHNGVLEFVGRVDDQIKIRGYRVDPREIESCLNESEWVGQSLVIVSEQNNSKMLVAYLTPSPEISVDLTEEFLQSDTAGGLNSYLVNENIYTKDDVISKIKEQMKLKLPAHMIPQVFVILDKFNLTDHGKIDRKKLPPVVFAQLNYIAPLGETEIKLAKLWQEILQLENISVTADFFELGGHSLLATRMVGMVSSILNKTVSVKTLFEYTTIRSLADYLELQPQQQKNNAIEPVDRSKHTLRVSHSQQRLWLLDKIDGGSAHYNIPASFRLKGKLDYQAMRLAFNSILERHESLRTCFASDVEGQPYQIIQAAREFVLPIADLSIQEKNQQQVEIARIISEESAIPFNLGGDLMLRAQMLKLDEDEHILLVTMHHIAADGWSMSILINEFSVLYNAYTRGQSNPLTPLAIQYADYAHWQRNWLQGNVLDQQLGYWTKQLTGLPVLHSLPLDHARPVMQSFVGDIFSAQIDMATSQALHSLCQAQGATIFMGLHAAFSVLLSRYSNETDIAVGSPIANREQDEVAGLIGFFVNTLVLRSDLSGNPSFIDLISQTKGILLDAYAHQQVPFEQIVEHLQPERSLSHGALFQVMLILQNNAQGDLSLPGLTLSPIENDATLAKYDLTLNAIETSQGLRLGWEYNTDLFQQQTITRMAGHFELLLKALVATPEESVFKVNLLGGQEQHQYLVEWNDTAIEYPNDKCIHHLFEAQAEARPDMVAVVYEGRQLTYRELNCQANRLANYLIGEQGVKPDMLVGICVERSLDMVVGILAILKAGGAYVPLDPEYPAARLAYMVEDAGLLTVLTQARLMGVTPISNKQALCLDDDEMHQHLMRQSQANPKVRNLESRHLAYVIYTSGSTGNPKGVMVEHQALVNRIDWMNREYGSSPSDRVLQKTPFSFDVSVWEFMWPLSVGAGIVLAKPGGHKDPVYLSALIRDQQITKLHFVPSMLGNMLALGDLSQCRTLQQVFCSGEALALHHVKDFQAICSWVELHNLYGPTEAAIDVSYWDCAQFNANLTSVPIGRPISNIQLFVLNQQLNPVPEHVAGELHIGGVGLARGYLNRDDLTAEKFIPNPFYDKTNPASSERLYKTGDLVRMLPDGNLEYLGRIDHQVKIRGFRIELGEIENVLLGFPEVGEAIALIKTKNLNESKLICYVTSTDVFGFNLTDLTEAELIVKLRDGLGLKLPNYMVPHHIIVLEKIPLTSNGKVDRKGLLNKKYEPVAFEYVPPSTKEEDFTVNVWASVLNLDPKKISITDNFFTLGGDSFLAVKLVSKINEELLLNLPLSSVFERQTPQSFSVFIAESLNKNKDSEAEMLQS